MEILILLAGLVFLGIVAALIFFMNQESSSKQNPPKTSMEKEVDGFAQYQKKIAVGEEKTKNLQTNLEVLQLELTQSKEREKSLLKEKSESTFNAEQYEKFKKDFAQLKIELTAKEELLEKEISEKRKNAQDLLQLQQDNDTLKKRVVEAEDSYRKTQTLLEVLKKDLEVAKRTIEEQKRIVSEHAENKIGGEWVSRDEFKTLENQLKEKEEMIQKLLAIKK